MWHYCGTRVKGERSDRWPGMESHMRIPTHIELSPLIEATLDVRYDPELPPDAVFGVVYDVVRKRYGTLQKLPILQLPDEIRQRDPNLIFQPYYKMASEAFQLQIGPRIFVLTSTAYPGWPAFKNELVCLFSEFTNRSLFKRITRVGFRYINFFPEGDLSSTTKISLNMGDAPFEASKTFVRTELVRQRFSTVLQLTNGARIRIDKLLQAGFVIDLDVSTKDPQFGASWTDSFEELIEEGHLSLKQDFFGLLQEKLLEKLNPKYD